MYLSTLVSVMLFSMGFMYMLLCIRDLEKRIVEAEMDLTLAKSQGYLKGQRLQTAYSSDRRLLAVIGVYTGFGSRLKRNVFRGSWMPKGMFGFWLKFTSSCEFLCSLVIFFWLRRRSKTFSGEREDRLK
jgi:hypothetical protein